MALKGPILHTLKQNLQVLMMKDGWMDPEAHDYFHPLL